MYQVVKNSALGLYTIAKYITENKLDTKVTVVTGVVYQHYCRNDKNAKKVLSVIQDIFYTFKVDKHIIHFLEGYNRRKDGMLRKCKI